MKKSNIFFNITESNFVFSFDNKTNNHYKTDEYKSILNTTNNEIISIVKNKIKIIPNGDLLNIIYECINNEELLFNNDLFELFDKDPNKHIYRIIFVFPQHSTFINNIQYSLGICIENSYETGKIIYSTIIYTNNTFINIKNKNINNSNILHYLRLNILNSIEIFNNFSINENVNIEKYILNLDDNYFSKKIKNQLLEFKDSNNYLEPIFKFNAVHIEYSFKFKTNLIDKYLKINI